jgi:hypothetical protein
VNDYLSCGPTAAFRLLLSHSHQFKNVDGIEFQVVNGMWLSWIQIALIASARSAIRRTGHPTRVQIEDFQRKILKAGDAQFYTPSGVPKFYICDYVAGQEFPGRG